MNTITEAASSYFQQQYDGANEFNLDLQTTSTQKTTSYIITATSIEDPTISYTEQNTINNEPFTKNNSFDAYLKFSVQLSINNLLRQIPDYICKPM